MHKTATTSVGKAQFTQKSKWEIHHRIKGNRSGFLSGGGTEKNDVGIHRKKLKNAISMLTFLAIFCIINMVCYDFCVIPIGWGKHMLAGAENGHR